MCAQNAIEQVKKKKFSTRMQLNLIYTYYYYNVTFIYLDVIVYGMVYVFVISKTYSELFSLSYFYVHQAE